MYFQFMIPGAETLIRTFSITYEIFSLRISAVTSLAGLAPEYHVVVSIIGQHDRQHKDHYNEHYHFGSCRERPRFLW
jgi:hypothetical protein